MIYLDAAATAGYSENGDLEDVIVYSIVSAMKEHWQNPSSLYANDVADKIDRCRANIADFIGANPNEIIFTSGASESNNTALRGWVDKELSGGFKTVNIITTPIEHKSILEALKNKNLYASIRYCDVDNCGVIDLNSLKSLLWLHEGESILVSIGMANNEIGTIQDIKTISDMVHKYGGILHIDATQAFGHIPINVNELGIDMMSVSGHKISPVLKGVGFLYKRNCVEIQPLIYGSQENGMRGGTENTFGIIGLSKAIDYCDVSFKKVSEMCDKRDYLINLLKSKFDIKLNGHKIDRLPNNINVVLPDGVSGEALLYLLSMSNVFISTSSACNSHDISPSYVLKSIGLTDEENMRSIRISISEDITIEDIKDFVDELEKAIRIIKE